ncbi:MAG: hypothetical protein CW691_05065 [Candidatus Bathyarchaeum sp.]|nr:MAG: hypothetical protein CW691_05065 [Candidatus Bathyarchaeum sp.]
MVKHINNIIRAIGIATCLIGAYLMAFGEPIIGVDHTGIATVVGIVGIGLISTGNTISCVEKKKEKP